MMHLRTCLTILFAAIIAISCKHDLPVTDIDQEMLNLARQTAGYTWYKNSDVFLSKSSGSGHNYARLRTRYNAAAATALDNNGKIKIGASFPEGSFIVKELSNGNTVERYALLWKRSGHGAADERGWIWGYINSNGTIAEPSSTNKGSGCKGCHSQAGSIDYMLMDKFFP